MTSGTKIFLAVFCVFALALVAYHGFYPGDSGPASALGEDGTVEGAIDEAGGDGSDDDLDSASGGARPAVTDPAFTDPAFTGPSAAGDGRGAASGRGDDEPISTDDDALPLDRSGLVGRGRPSGPDEATVQPPTGAGTDATGAISDATTEATTDATGATASRVDDPALDDRETIALPRPGATPADGPEVRPVTSDGTGPATPAGERPSSLAPPGRAGQPAAGPAPGPGVGPRRPSGTPAAPGARPAATTRQHVIRPGETLSGIAAALYDDPAQWRRILRANPGIEPTRLQVGLALVIPPLTAEASGTAAADAPRPRVPGGYVVRAGDSLYRIAERELGDGLRWREIHAANRAVIGDDPTRIQVGMELRLPPRR